MSKSRNTLFSLKFARFWYIYVVVVTYCEIFWRNSVLPSIIYIINNNYGQIRLEYSSFFTYTEQQICMNRLKEKKIRRSWRFSSLVFHDDLREAIRLAVSPSYAQDNKGPSQAGAPFASQCGGKGDGGLEHLSIKIKATKP